MSEREIVCSVGQCVVASYVCTNNSLFYVHIVSIRQTDKKKLNKQTNEQARALTFKYMCTVYYSEFFECYRECIILSPSTLLFFLSFAHVFIFHDFWFAWFCVISRQLLADSKSSKVHYSVYFVVFIFRFHTK